ncbi:chemotaxis protein CheA [Catenovulum sediminis]|uniref:histidine kinase n=1 Tax=Catenovulum sediminis TaxID=1740262 RepID=A0ABV1RN06_9ALTE
MNPLLEQFLGESRELLEFCDDTFLQLEKNPQDSDTLNRLFRYVHTIKGGSGLFEIAPFTQLVHVAEDSLSKAREGLLQISSDGIDLYLQILDQLTSWLDELEENGQLGELSIQQSEVLVGQIRQRILKENTDQPKQELPVVDELSVTSVEQVMSAMGLQGVNERLLCELKEQVENLQQSANLVVYRPDTNAFFSGDDPICFWLQLPDLLWQGIDGDFSQENLNAFDPYACKLTFLALTAADETQIKENLNYVWHSVALHKIMPIDRKVVPDNSVKAAFGVEEVLFSQMQILLHIDNNPHPESSLASVSRVLSGLVGTVPELDKLPPIQNEPGKLNPDYLKALECITAEGSATDCVSEPDLSNDQKLPAKITPSVGAPANNMQTAKSEPIRTIKVDQDKLEQLVDLAGELIVAKNSLNHLARKVENEYGIKALTRDIKCEHGVLNRITESLQDVVMQIRMIPVATIFQRFPRLVRDLSRRLGKDIDLQVCGEETEADKNIVEQLADPLIHLVRNSIDHGIEMPSDRQKAGKSSTGVIRLVAKNIQDSVQIEIQDDGAGIDPEVIKEKAVSKGVISKDAVAGMSDEDVLQLIFEPGFSTCEQVSELSGRGVGMDVVKTTVNRLGGMIDLQSTKGEGSVIRVTLPASITVSRVMMFEMDEQVYGIPVEGLTETIKIRPQQIRRIKQGESYVLRNKLVPLYRMHKLLGIRSTKNQPELPILNLNINGTVAGFAVDKLLEGVDVIIKPLEGIMSRFPLYSGAAVLGDGRVLLVLNPKEMQLCH